MSKTNLYVFIGIALLMVSCKGNNKSDSESLKDFFYNNTYYFENGDYTFVKGLWTSGWGGQAELDTIIKSNLTGTPNEYILSFKGNWGGGNSGWHENLVVRIENGNIRNLFHCTSSMIPQIKNGNLIITTFKWKDGDARCCPSHKVVIEYNSKFIIVSEQESIK